jgi:hypothetical protein
MTIAAAALAGAVVLTSSPAWARTQTATAGPGGTWGTAKEVPGIAALDAGAGAEINSLSCASPGNCSAGGEYSSDSSGHGQAFVVSQAGGIWGSAIEVPGSGALNVTGDARVSSVSCASPGDCSAGGDYTDSSHHLEAFVDSQA